MKNVIIHRSFIFLVLLLVVLSLTMLSAIAQETTEIALQEIENQLSLNELMPETEAMSVMQASHDGNNQEDSLMATTSVISPETAGMCEVVNGILADFCSSFPADSNCQF